MYTTINPLKFCLFLMIKVTIMYNSTFYFFSWNEILFFIFHSKLVGYGFLMFSLKIIHNGIWYLLTVLFKWIAKYGYFIRVQIWHMTYERCTAKFSSWWGDNFEIPEPELFQIFTHLHEYLEISEGEFQWDV